MRLTKARACEEEKKKEKVRLAKQKRNHGRPLGKEKMKLN